MTKLPIDTPPANLRQRVRADGTVRIWWEPSAAARRLGFDAVELDAARLTWSVREAERINRELDRAKDSGRRAVAGPNGRTVSALIAKYRGSSAWANHAPKTCQSYDAQLRLIDQKWGAYKVADFSKPIMHEWYEALLASKGLTTAMARLRHMSILMSYAELLGWRAENSNPCARLKLRTPKGRRRTASWAEVDALLAAAAELDMPGMATAIAMGLFQGQRQTDLRLATITQFRRRSVQLMGWPEARDVWVWALVRSKRGNEGAMIIHDSAAPLLEAAIAAATRRATRGGVVNADDLATQPLIWDDRADLSFTGPHAEHRFQKRWDAIRNRAGTMLRETGDLAAAEAIEGLQFRDLRRTFGALSRAGGATKDDAADVLGNSAATDQLLADIYMAPSFETASRAVMAVQRPKEAQRRKA